MSDYHIRYSLYASYLYPNKALTIVIQQFTTIRQSQ